MNPKNIKVLYIAAIAGALYGGYVIVTTGYSMIVWEQAEGTVVNFERHSLTCGKGVGECYTLIVRYVDQDNGVHSLSSKTKFDRNPPTHLKGENIPVYYSPGDPAEAILGGSYGDMKYGIWAVVFGLIMYVVYLIARRHDSG